MLFDVSSVFVGELEKFVFVGELEKSTIARGLRILGATYPCCTQQHASFRADGMTPVEAQVQRPEQLSLGARSLPMIDSHFYDLALSEEQIYSSSVRSSSCRRHRSCIVCVIYAALVRWGRI